MSQGNDAFSSKDADSNAEPPKGTSENSGSAAAEEASEAREASKAQSASESGQASSSVDRGGDSERADQEESQTAKGVRGRDENEPARNRKRGSGSRRTSRDDEEDELQPPQTEEALNVPKMQTIYMLAAMSVLTVILWFAAKLSCNIHPDQVRDPKHFSTIELAADPKNAAFEFHHRFETGDYATALDLSTGEMRKTVEAKLKECEQDADACAKNMARLSGTIKSTGRLLDQVGNRATVELSSVSQLAPGQKTHSFELVKEGDFWRVASSREVANPSTVAEAPAAQVAASAAPPSSAARPGVESGAVQQQPTPANP
ncbi:MAG TPA: hypothetical protein VKP30_14615 [Polyangiaceae bacterium]|nr:hypothetical protein [Polyangiaceae bacterium]